MDLNEKLIIIMPAYNEADNIELVATQWNEIAEKTHAQLLIIDDGSQDNTYSKTLELQKDLPTLKVISKPNSGHGATVLYGYHYALEHGADYVFQTDSDGQTVPSEFLPMWEMRDQYDLQIGYRKDRQDGFSRILTTKVLKLVLLLIFHLNIKDANTPFRLMSASSLKEVIKYIPKDHNLSNILLTVNYTKRNYRIRYWPITFRERQGGVNSINLKKIVGIGINAIKDFWKLRKVEEVKEIKEMS